MRDSGSDRNSSSDVSVCGVGDSGRTVHGIGTVVLAFLRLSAGSVSHPLMLPGKNVLNLGALVAFAVLTGWFVVDRSCVRWSP